MGGVLVALGSAKGSPGATTLALALAASWPTSARRPRPLLVEADPSGGDVAARFGVSDTPGLMDLAAATRRAASPRVLGECVQMLPGEIHAVVGPAGAQQASAAVALFAAKGVELLRAGMGTAGTVLLDLGRLQHEAAGLVEAADRVLLVTRGQVDALSHAAAKREELRSTRCEVELVLVGSSPYPVAEIGRVLDIAQVYRVPWDPKTAGALVGGPAISPRRWQTAPLVRAARTLAEHLDASHRAPAGLGAESVPAACSGPEPIRARVLEAGEVR